MKEGMGVKSRVDMVEAIREIITSRIVVKEVGGRRQSSRERK